MSQNITGKSTPTTPGKEPWQGPRHMAPPAPSGKANGDSSHTLIKPAAKMKSATKRGSK